MNQDQQPQNWWKDNWPVLALVALAVVITTVVGLGYLLEWDWTGLDTKLAWDWLELLIIPLVLALGAFWFNNQIRKSDQEIAHRDIENDRQIAADRVQEEALHRYLDRMQELILDKGLRKSEEDAEIRNVARARTFAVLRSLDGNRKAKVARFLHESGLITGKVVREELGERQVIGAIIDLSGADLIGADLSHANLFYANLSYTNLSGANLSGSKGWTNEQLAKAASLIGATMPDGTRMTEKGWEEFKKQHRQ
jgi:Pentapeptide repeats (8 copies)